MREVLRSKIHRCWVTSANLGYVGSILIDRDLMEQTDIVAFEKVQVLNINNGAPLGNLRLAGRARQRHHRRSRRRRPAVPGARLPHHPRL